MIQRKGVKAVKKRKARKPHTFSIEDAVFEKAKKIASEQGVSLSSLVEGLLREYATAWFHGLKEQEGEK